MVEELDGALFDLREERSSWQGRFSIRLHQQRSGHVHSVAHSGCVSSSGNLKSTFRLTPTTCVAVGS